MIILELSLAAQYLMNTFVIPVFYVFIAALIPFFIGKKRQIGFGWSWVFCITATPIIGAVITFLSKKLTDSPPSYSKVKIIIGWVFVVIAVLILLSNINNQSLLKDIYILLSNLAYLLFGIYLINIGKGKVYNKKYIEPTDSISSSHS